MDINQVVAAGVAAFMAVKALGIYGVARAFGADHREALQRSALFAQGGEFAFVLYAAALAAGVFDVRAGAVMSAIVILSMALTPIVVLLLDRFLPRPAISMHGIEEPPCLTGRVLRRGLRGGRLLLLVRQGFLLLITDSAPERERRPSRARAVVEMQVRSVRRACGPALR